MRSHTPALYALTLSALLIGCKGPTQTDEPLPEGVPAEGLTISPLEATVTTNPDAQETLQFSATVELADGSTLDATPYVVWSASNRSAGEVDEAGLFTPSGSNGGVTWVTAEYGGFEAQATVVVVYTDEQNIGAGDSALFTGAEVELTEDAWLYPSDGVNIPRNTPSVFFQWQDMGADAYRLRFQSRVSDITIYTDENGWASEGENWQIIAGTNAGGEVEVELAASIDGEVHVAAPIGIGVNRLDARGSIYYWSSSVRGIKRIPYGAAEPENFFSTYELNGSCVGCHAIGPKPDYQLAYSFVEEGENPEEGFLELSTLEDPETSLVSEEDGYNGSSKSFSPDGELLLLTSNGVMELFETDGTYLGDVTPYGDDVGEPGGVVHAEWSPDGTRIAITLSEFIIHDTQSYENKIAVMDYLGEGVFSDPTVLVDPQAYLGGDTYNAYYPTWSPDGAWIAFNISTGDTYDDEDAALWVVSPDGGDPIELVSANEGEGLTNSWPKWGPLPDDDILWLAFASKRNYGYVSTSGTPQIWLAAFDPRRIEEGLDPSWPAFWLPGQDTEQNNHLPVWVD